MTLTPIFPSTAWDQGQASVVTNLPGYQQRFGVDSGTNATAIRHFVSLVYIGDGVGAALSYFLNDRLGRLWSFRFYTLIYIIGQLISTFSPNLACLYASRIITGLGIGSLSATAPMSIAEIAPAEIRGMLTAWYPTVMGLALLAANFCVYGVSLHVGPGPLQFQIVWFAPCIYMGLLMIASFFVCESPRWLLLKDREDEAINILVRIRGLPASHPRVHRELSDMREDIRQSYELYANSGSKQSDLVNVIKETFTVPGNLRRVQQAMVMYALPQLSGANAVTSYLVPILDIIGASGDDARNIFLSGMYSMAKFFFALLTSLFFIDMLGRRRSLFTGITIQMLTDLYIGIYVQRRQSGVDISPDASRAAISAIYIHALGYAVGKSSPGFPAARKELTCTLTGLFVLPYVFGGELWPNRIRSFGAALSQAWHWLFHYAMTSAAPSLLDSMDNWGAFIFYAGWCAFALVYVYLVVPEIANLTLEEIDDVFRGSWFKAYKRRKPTTHGQAVDGDGAESQRYLNASC